MNTQDRGFRSTRYYVELTKNVQKELGEIKPNSWIGEEHLLILELALEDYSHLPANEQQLIKKVNGTLVNIKNKKENTRNSSNGKPVIKTSESENKLDEFAQKRPTIIMEPSRRMHSFLDTSSNIKSEVPSSSKQRTKIRMSKVKPTIDTKPEGRISINLKIHDTQNLTPSKLRKGTEKKEDQKREIWKL